MGSEVKNTNCPDFMFLPQKTSRELLIAILLLFHAKFVHFRGFPSEYLNYWDTHSGETLTPNPKWNDKHFHFYGPIH